MIKSIFMGVALVAVGAAGGYVAIHFMDAGAKAEASTPPATGDQAVNADQSADAAKNLPQDKPYPMAGSWAPRGESCDSGAGYKFQADHRYVTEGEQGRWKTTATTIEMADDKGTLKEVSRSEVHIRWTDGNTTEFRRCSDKDLDPWGTMKPRFSLVALTAGDLGDAGAASCRFQAGGKTLMVVSETGARVRYNGGVTNLWRENEPNGDAVSYSLPLGTGMMPLELTVAMDGPASMAKGKANLRVWYNDDDNDDAIVLVAEQDGTLDCTVT